MSDPLDTVAFITGASRGVGRLLSEGLASDGVRVAGFARDSPELELLRDEPGFIVPIPTDVTSRRSVDDSFKRAVSEVGHPELLVTCAGSIDALGPVTSVDAERWWESLAVDVFGTMLFAQAAARSMVEQGRGRIVTVYGNLGDHGMENVSAFAAGKAAVARFTETLATELAGTGVVALCMHPGFVHTPMTEYLASSSDGRRCIPGFGDDAPLRWGDGAPAVDLVRRVQHGHADQWSGRLIHVADTFEKPPAASDDRRLRVHLSDD